MKYIGLNSQIWRNNFKSVILLILFPVVILGLVWLFVFLVQPLNEYRIERANQLFLTSLPWVLAGVGVWFVIAWFSHTGMIERATGSRPLSRKENKRIYNLVENLCIAGGMPMPKVNIIDDDSLNAFASGINTSTFTVSLSRGIIDKLDDAELEAVIAHELTHIRNRDVRLLIVSIIFVGIFAFLTEALVRSVRFSGGSNKKRRQGGNCCPFACRYRVLPLIDLPVCHFASARIHGRCRFGNDDQKSSCTCISA